MDWRRETIRDLNEYRALEEFVSDFQNKKEDLDAMLSTMKGPTLNSEPISKNSGSRAEDNWINIIVKKERLLWNYNIKKKQLERLDRCFGLLTETEKIVLKYFYIERPNGHVNLLMKKLNLEKSQVYRIKDTALRRLTIALYGTPED